MARVHVCGKGILSTAALEHRISAQMANTCACSRRLQQCPCWPAWMVMVLLLTLQHMTGAHAGANTTGASTQSITSFAEAATTLGVTAFLQAVSNQLDSTLFGNQGKGLDSYLQNVPPTRVPTYVDVIDFLASQSQLGIIVAAPSDTAMQLWESDVNFLTYHILPNCTDFNLPGNTADCISLLNVDPVGVDLLQTSPQMRSFLNVSIHLKSQQQNFFTGPRTFHGTADSFATSSDFECVPFGLNGASLVCKIDRALVHPKVSGTSGLPTVYNYLKYERKDITGIKPHRTVCLCTNLNQLDSNVDARSLSSDMTTLCAMIERNAYKPVKETSADGVLSPGAIRLLGLNRTLQEIMNTSSYGTFFAPTDDAWSSYFKTHNLDKEAYLTSPDAANLVTALWFWDMHSTSEVDNNISNIPKYFVGAKSMSNGIDMRWGWYKSQMMYIHKFASSQIATVLDHDKVAGKAYVHVIDTVIDAYNIVPTSGSTQR